MKEQVFQEGLTGLSELTYSQGVAVVQEMGLAIMLLAFMPITVGLVVGILTDAFTEGYGKIDVGTILIFVSAYVTSIVLLIASPYLVAY